VAQQGKSDELVTLQELAVSNAYEIAPLVAATLRCRESGHVLWPPLDWSATPALRCDASCA
jgi:hypothetical protein